jgi:transposase
MGNLLGVKRDFAALERRRLEALALLDRGLSSIEVARRMNVSPQTVSRWAKAIFREGREALRAAGRAGRKPKLDDDQRARLLTLLLEGPHSFEYKTEEWTSEQVADLIDSQFRIRYHPGHVWKLLRQLKWRERRAQ